MSEQLPQPGWYHNASGQTQWWDGQAWGQLADDFVADQAVAADQPAEPAQPVEPIAPVAQEFSREYLEQHYGEAGGSAPSSVTESNVDATDTHEQFTPQSLTTTDEVHDFNSAPESSMQLPVSEPPAYYEYGAAPTQLPPAQIPAQLQNTAYQAPAQQAPAQQLYSTYNAPGTPATPGVPPAPGAPGVYGQPGPYGQPGIYPQPGAYGQPAQGNYQYGQAASAPKPATHTSTWLAFGAVGIGLVSALTGGLTFTGFLVAIAWLAVLAAVVFGVIAIVRSAKKALPIVATVLGATGFIWVPIILVLSTVAAYGSNSYLFY